MQIPFLDLRRQHKEIEAEIRAALERVAASGLYVLDGEVQAFEQEWRSFCGTSAAAGVNSGTDALTIALLASDAVRPGRQDEVITSPLTAGYTGLAILNAGAIPIFADIDPHSCTLDPQAIEVALTPRTRAIVPVHLYGQLADMTGIQEVAKRRGLVVVEDAAQAHGASDGIRCAGAFGQAAAFSFYPTKNLGAYGDGGAVVSDDLRLIERVKELRQGGQLSAMQANITGRNSRLDEMQAALLRIKLRHLDKWNQRRCELAELYRSRLSHCSQLEMPFSGTAGSHVYHLFVVKHPDRDRLRDYLAARGIETMIHYPFLLHQQPLFRHEAQRPLPTAERVVNRIFSLPLYPQLRNEELLSVTEAIFDFERGA